MPWVKSLGCLGVELKRSWSASILGGFLPKDRFEHGTRMLGKWDLLHISSSIILYHSIYLGPYLTTWRLPHLEERRFNLRAIYKVVLTDRRMATTVDSHDPPWWIDWQTIKGGYHESSQIQVMWLKQCHKPPIWEWFITNGDGLLLFYPHYPISQTTIWDG
jgi:hypothetical protein